MNINLKRLRDELRWVSRFVETKSTIPILSNALLSQSNGTLTITGTDLETAGVAWINDTEGEDWSLTVPVRQVLKYLDSLNGSVDTVQIYPAHGSTHVVIQTDDGGKSRFEGMLPDSYPELPVVNPQLAICNLGWAAPRALAATCDEESRFTLNGALLEIDGTGSRMVSTDGHRLSLLDLKVSSREDTPEVKVIVGSFALGEAAEMAGDGLVMFGSDGTHLMFAVSGRMIVSRVLHGNFPNYERVMPKVERPEVEVDVEGWKRSIKRVAPFSDERSRAMVLTIGSDITFYVKSDVEAEQHLPVSINGPEFQTGFNWGYLKDFLDLAPQDGVTFLYEHPHRAAELQCPGWRYICQPMRI